MRAVWLDDSFHSLKLHEILNECFGGRRFCRPEGLKYHGPSEIGSVLHVALELLEVLVLLCQLALELQKLLLLAALDSVVLVGLLTLGEGITGVQLAVLIFCIKRRRDIPLSAASGSWGTSLSSHGS